ncbi:hypothetical protein LOK49_LG04G02823 [Camellia lanceoleosa]|uniref:Uncharacterized protein n=1 Tax=Camellia lanceoleosa TaxID=1840588 RepID=A0ACC0HZN3_9ERIC|nr:hypothetical protein LOK49_LG04G02823 [Camellia lanceoleosa]
MLGKRVLCFEDQQVHNWTIKLTQSKERKQKEASPPLFLDEGYALERFPTTLSPKPFHFADDGRLEFGSCMLSFFLFFSTAGVSIVMNSIFLVVSTEEDLVVERGWAVIKLPDLSISSINTQSHPEFNGMCPFVEGKC